jgi:hypothetical protein
MKALSTLVRLVVGCPHENSYRERRPLHGLDVLHLVCEDCGRAVPAIDRTREEHEHIVRAGAVPRLQARPLGLRTFRKSA